MNKCQLQKIIFEIDNIIKSDDLFLLRDSSELLDVLNLIEKNVHTKIFYFYRANIQDLLEQNYDMINLDKDDYIHNKYILQNLFYLSIAIRDNILVVNYSYDIDFIKEIDIIVKDEKLKLKKFILSILFLTIIYNFKGFDDSNSEKTNNICEEIEEYLKCQKMILEEYNLNLDFDDNINIEEIYIRIIITLIRKKKLENYNYSKHICEQLDLENIELTSEIYEQLKDEFEQNSEKEYINCYKIQKLEDLFKEQNINFYYILIKYIFKSQIYFYNIKFFLQTLNILASIEKDNAFELFKYLAIS